MNQKQTEERWMNFSEIEHIAQWQLNVNKQGIFSQTEILYDLKVGYVGELESKGDSIGKTDKDQFVKGFLFFAKSSSSSVLECAHISSWTAY